jgi:uncharacterized membrane protein
MGPLVLVWLLFLPNAPYIATDIVHMAGREGAMALFDLTIFGAAAAAGLTAFTITIGDVGRVVATNLGDRLGRTTVLVAIWLSAIGIYLGRALRWNSWDPFVKPIDCVHDLASHLADARILVMAIVLVVALGTALKASVTLGALMR